MEITSQQVTLRKLTASEGKIITDVATKTLQTKLLFLGKDDSPDNYIEVGENEINFNKMGE